MKKILGLAVVALLAVGQEASATHGRGMAISWQQGTGADINKVTYHVTESWRRSYPWGVTPNVGTIINVGGMTTAGGSVSSGSANTAKVELINLAQDWFIASRTFTVTYPSVGTYATTFNQCCRISTLQEGNNDHDYIVSTSVVMNNVVGGARSPDVVAPGLAVFATDLPQPTTVPNNPFLVHLTNDALNTFRLGVALPAPSSEWVYGIAPGGTGSGGSGLLDTIPGSGVNQLSVSPTGDFTWDTPNCLGCLYGFQINLTNTVTGSKWDYDMVLTLTDQPLTNFWTNYTPTLPPEEPVPAPGALLLLGVGLLGLATRRRLAVA